MRPVKLLTIARRLLGPLALLCAQSGCAADGQGGWWRSGSGQSQNPGQGWGLFRGDRVSQLENENQQLRAKLERLAAEADETEERLIQRASESEEIEAELQATQRLLARYRRERTESSSPSADAPTPPARDNWSSGDEERGTSARTTRKPPTSRIAPGSLKTAPPAQRVSEPDGLPMRAGETPLNLPRSPIRNPRIETSVAAFEDDDSDFSNFDDEPKAASPWLPVQRGLSRETEKFDFGKNF